MILHVKKDCFVEGRKYAETMVVSFPDYLAFPEGVAEKAEDTNIVITHVADDLEKLGIVEVE